MVFKHLSGTAIANLPQGFILVSIIIDIARRYGLLDEHENPDDENLALMKAANEQIARWMDERFANDGILERDR